MPFVNIANGAWTEVVTTTGDTVFQNRAGVTPMYLTTEDTTSLPVSEGFYLASGQSVVISTGQAVEAVCVGGSGNIFYMLLE